MAYVASIGAHDVISVDDFLHMQLTDEQNWFSRFQCDIVLDAAGLSSVRHQSIELLQPGGHYCDLNGHGIRKIDEMGILQGVTQAAVLLAEESSVLRRKACHHHWVLFEENHKVSLLRKPKTAPACTQHSDTPGGGH